MSSGGRIHIVRDPTIFGGRPIIAGHRISVHDVASLMQRGEPLDAVATGFQLTEHEVEAAVAYYRDHQQEIDRELCEDESEIAARAVSDTSAPGDRLRQARREYDILVQYEVGERLGPGTDAVVAVGDCLETLAGLPDGFAELIITSPPYNLGKSYERAVAIDAYLSGMAPVIDQLVRVLSPTGSMCWQVGNFVDDGEVIPLDVEFYPLFKQRGLKLRNRIIWHFGHGLHASRRFSGRYEVMLWFTKSDFYTFNLDSVRVPSKYPGKRHFKGDKYGRPSGNPLGKNPSDFWTALEDDWESMVWNIPNVKSNHPEKTIHPCQFPIELVERCVLALTNEGDWVLDPYAGVGSALVAGLKHGRRAFGCEREPDYAAVVRQRIADLGAGTLRYRPMGKPVYEPTGREKVSQIPAEWSAAVENE